MVLRDLPIEWEGLKPKGGDEIVGDDKEGGEAGFDDGCDTVLSVELWDAQFSTAAGGGALPGLEDPLGE